MLNACYDILDKRNYQYGLFETLWTQLPKKVLLNDWKITNQWYARYWYWCVAFSTTNWINEILYTLKEEKDPIVLFEEMVSKKLLDIKKGAYIIDWPKTSKLLGWITWYLQVNTLREIKDSLYKKRPLVIWSNKINWSLTKKFPHIAIEWNSYWHRFLIVWYDDDKQLLTCENSYWDTFDYWRFYISYDDIWLLFPSKFSLYIDKADNFSKLKEYIKEAKSIWYVNYTNNMVKIKDKTSKDYKLRQQAWRTVFLKAPIK